MDQLQTQPARQEASTPLSGALRSLLAANLGRYVVAEFAAGAECLTRKAGVLTAVEAEYLILLDEDCRSDIVADLQSLRFITFCGADPATPIAEDNGNVAGEAAPRTDNAAPQSNGSASQTPGNAAGGVTPVMAPIRAQSQAALNYAKRKARKLN